MSARAPLGLLVGALLGLLLAPPPARAHDAGQGRLSVTLGADGAVALRVEMGRVDALDLLGLEPDSPIADAALADGVRGAFGEWIALSAAAPCPVSVAAVEPLGLRGLTVDATATCAGGPVTLDWKAARHPRLSLAMVGTLTAADGAQTPLALGRLSPTVTWGASPPSVGAFLLSGVEHILIGWDHLAFLLAILLGVGRLTRVLAVVTAFTVAHSITLALGATGALTLPPEPVEAVIAASIAVAAGLGLLRWRAGTLDHPGRPPDEASSAGPWAAVAVCFAFGLVHGLGFAGILAEMLPGSDGFLGPLVAFNVGVELGQVAVVAVVFPLLAALGRSAVGRSAIGGLLVGLCALGAIVAALRLAG